MNGVDQGNSQLSHHFAVFSPDTSIANGNNHADLFGIVDLFEELWKSGTTILLITHDSTVATRTNRVVYLKDGTVRSQAREMAADMKALKERKRLDTMQ